MSRQSRPPERIGDIVKAVLADRGYLTVCREQDVQRRWPELVGDRIAAVTECTGVDHGKVLVRVRSASWRNELVYLKTMLLAKLKSECASIKDIIIT